MLLPNSKNNSSDYCTFIALQGTAFSVWYDVVSFCLACLWSKCLRKVFWTFSLTETACITIFCTWPMNQVLDNSLAKDRVVLRRNFSWYNCINSLRISSARFASSSKNSMMFACTRPRFWNSITDTSATILPNGWSSFKWVTRIFCFIRNTRLHKSGLSPARWPKSNESSISGHRGLQVIVSVVDIGQAGRWWEYRFHKLWKW